MITADEIRGLIQQAMPDAQVDLEDLTGGADHWRAVVVSQAFDGRSRIEQHQLVYASLGDEMKGRIHALQLKTLTPAQAAQAGLASTPSKE